MNSDFNTNQNFYGSDVVNKDEKPSILSYNENAGFYPNNRFPEKQTRQIEKPGAWYENAGFYG